MSNVKFRYVSIDYIYFNLVQGLNVKNPLYHHNEHLKNLLSYFLSFIHTHDGYGPAGRSPSSLPSMTSYEISPQRASGQLSTSCCFTLMLHQRLNDHSRRLNGQIRNSCFGVKFKQRQISSDLKESNGLGGGLVHFDCNVSSSPSFY